MVGVRLSGARGGAHVGMVADVDEVVKLYFVNGLECWGCTWRVRMAVRPIRRGQRGDTPQRSQRPGYCLVLRRGPSTARADAFAGANAKEKASARSAQDDNLKKEKKAKWTGVATGGWALVVWKLRSFGRLAAASG
jgi:hypothetical protein